MGKVWTESMIREEISKLDAITGLSGSSVSILFMKGSCTLGLFSAEGKMYFKFSTVYFHDPDWPEESAVQVIRHEYAHYMTWMEYGTVKHNAEWRKCCMIVGASPSRVYGRIRNDFYSNEHEKKSNDSERYDRIKIGTRLSHPVYGKGKVTAIAGQGISRIASVEFENVGVKRITLKWIDENCAC